MTSMYQLARRTCLRRMAAAFVAASGLLPIVSHAQETFPTKPVHIVVPYAAGGTTDLLARLVGQKLSERWGQAVVVDNRPGGGTVIGASAVARSAPDGYTLLLANNTHVINQHLMANLPYDSIRDFTPVSTLATSAYLLLLNPAVSAHTLSEFLAYAKATPGKVTFGIHGYGGLTHLAAELMDSIAGIKMVMVPYKGAGPAMIGILGHEVDIYLDAPATTLSYVQSGQLRAIGISGQTRLPALPDVPTMAEAGIPGFDVTIWYGLLGAAGTPAAVVTRINSEIAAVLALPDVKQKLDSLGVAPFSSTPAEFANLMQTELAKYGRVIKAADIK